jgi:hypothetical protein
MPPCNIINTHTVKPLFIIFVGGLKKKTVDAGAMVEIGFAQGPQKLKDGSGNNR